MRLVLDTNIWISYLISNSFKELDNLIIKKEVILLFSFESLNEFHSVIQRPKLQKYFNRRDIQRLLDTFNEYGEFVKIDSSIRLSRDPKDDFLLNLSRDGNADYLITGDNDLLALGGIDDTEIITYSMFRAKINP